MEYVATFAERLKELLQIKNITQAELSRKTGVSKSSITHYIKGDWKGKQDVVYAISSEFGINEPWLLGCDVPMYKDDVSSIPASDNIINLPTSKEKVHLAPAERNEVDEELMELIQRLTPEQKKLLMALIRGLLDSQ